jgi:hypothetical protein
LIAVYDGASLRPLVFGNTSAVGRDGNFFTIISSSTTASFDDTADQPQLRAPRAEQQLDAFLTAIPTTRHHVAVISTTACCYSLLPAADQKACSALAELPP